VLAHTAPPTHRTGPSRTGVDHLPTHAAQTMPRTHQNRAQGIDRPMQVLAPMVGAPIDPRPHIDKDYRRADVGSPPELSSALSIT